MKQCSNCEYFNRLYAKSKDKYYKTKYGFCKSKNKTIRSTYICTEYSEKEKENE